MSKLYMQLLAIILTTATVAGPVAAETSWGVRSGSITMGLVNGISPGLGIDGGGAIGLNLDAVFAEVNSNLQIEGGILYWNKTYESNYQDSFFGEVLTSKLSLRDLGFTSGVRYVIGTSSKSVFPYANGGVAYHAFTSKWENGIGSSDTVGLGGSTGLYFGGGADYRLNDSLNLRGQLQYHTAAAGYWTASVGISKAFS